jgi:3-oxoacyl-[acyl-carrier protein] reductase
MKRLEGKVALVTGAGNGIGAATALRFANEGAIVGVNDMNEAAAGEVVKQITDNGGTAYLYAGSVTDNALISGAMSEMAAKHGHFDILINNAGVLRDAMSAKMTEEQWDTVLNVHLKGTWLACKAAFAIMKEQGSGAIVNTSSVSALGNIGQANYSAAKAGIVGLTRTLALEYARYNVRVNAIAPGFIETAMTAQIPEQLREQALQRVPLRRMGSADEIAKVHVFLSSDDASYVTGQVITVDGGSTPGV